MNERIQILFKCQCCLYCVAMFFFSCFLSVCCLTLCDLWVVAICCLTLSCFCLLWWCLIGDGLTYSVFSSHFVSRCFLWMFCWVLSNAANHGYFQFIYHRFGCLLMEWLHFFLSNFIFSIYCFLPSYFFFL